MGKGKWEKTYTLISVDVKRRVIYYQSYRKGDPVTYYSFDGRDIGFSSESAVYSPDKRSASIRRFEHLDTIYGEVVGQLKWAEELMGTLPVHPHQRREDVYYDYALHGGNKLGMRLTAANIDGGVYAAEDYVNYYLTLRDLTLWLDDDRLDDELTRLRDAIYAKKQLMINQ